jgi:hypothetical protein
MTIDQAHTLIRIKFDRVASGIDYNFLSEEIDIYINDAVDKFINEQYLALRSERSNQQSAMVYENLRNLITRDTLTLSQSSISDDALEANLPMDYRNYISSRSLVPSGNVNNRKVTINEFYKFLTTLTDTPLHKDYVACIDSNTIFVTYEFNGEEPTEVFLHYLKEPVPVDYDAGVTIDLPPSVHTNIVNMTVQLMRQDMYIPQRQPEEEDDS